MTEKRVEAQKSFRTSMRSSRVSNFIVRSIWFGRRVDDAGTWINTAGHWVILVTVAIPAPIAEVIAKIGIRLFRINKAIECSRGTTAG